MGWYPITLPITVFLKIQSYDIAVVFDRSHDFSIKSSTKADKGKFSARNHFLTPSSLLSEKSVTLTSASWKSQIISDLIDGQIQKAVSGSYSNTLLVSGLLATPTDIIREIAIERQDLETSHSAINDLITVQ